MTYFKPALVALTLVAAPAAWADVTALDVWNDTIAMSESSGLTVTGTVDSAGAITTVRDVTLVVDAPEFSFTGKLGDMKLTETGIGTVEISTPPVYPVTITAMVEGESVEVTVLLSHQGERVVASGNPGAIIYDYSYDSLTANVTDIKAEDAPGEIAMQMTLDGFKGRVEAAAQAAARQTVSDIAIAALKTTVNATDPEKTGRFSLAFDLNDYRARTTTVTPAGVSVFDMGAKLRAGFRQDSTASVGGAAFDMRFVDDETNGAVRGTLGQSTTDVLFSKDRLVLLTNQKDIDVTVTSADMPFGELGTKIADTSFGLTMPIAPSDEAGDIRILTSFKGLEIAEVLWSMFDPMGQLPRDPANVVLDLKGKGRWMMDILDESSYGMTSDVLGEIESLQIADLEVSVAGASLTGSGAFDIDNTDLSTFPGMPAPSGQATLRLSGAMGLMDKLVAMGLIPQDQVMGVKMMLGLFARSVGEDEMESVLEITEDGAILANGQRLQ